MKKMLASVVGVVLVGAAVMVALPGEDQGLCFVAAEPGYVLAMNGEETTSTLVPTSLSAPAGAHRFTITTPYGTAVHGKLRVYDAKSPVITSSDNVTVTDTVAIDFCTFFSDADYYPVADDGAIQLYTSPNVPTGFRTPLFVDGISFAMNVVPSPDGRHVAYTAVDPNTEGSIGVYVAQPDGKHPVLLGTRTKDEGEILPEFLDWSSSGYVVFAERTPVVAGDPENLPSDEGFAYRITTYKASIVTGEVNALRIENE